MSYECPALQATMDAAYDRWQANREMKPKDFLESLSAKESFAVRIGNLNYQVENGGFSQYWGNSYAMHGSIGAVVDYCTLIVAWSRSQPSILADALAAAAEVLHLVTRAAEIIGTDVDPNKRRATSGGRGYWDDEEDENEGVDADLEAAGLDRKYYAVNDAWMNLAEAYFVATFK